MDVEQIFVNTLQELNDIALVVKDATYMDDKSADNLYRYVAHLETVLVHDAFLDIIAMRSINDAMQAQAVLVAAINDLVSLLSFVDNTDASAALLESIKEKLLLFMIDTNWAGRMDFARRK